MMATSLNMHKTAVTAPQKLLPGSFSFSFFIGDGKMNLLSCDILVMLQQSPLFILLAEVTYGSYHEQDFLGIAEISGQRDASPMGYRSRGAERYTQGKLVCLGN
jgi:hypothetical protein